MRVSQLRAQSRPCPYSARPLSGQASCVARPWRPTKCAINARSRHHRQVEMTLSLADVLHARLRYLQVWRGAVCAGAATGPHRGRRTKQPDLISMEEDQNRLNGDTCPQWREIEPRHGGDETANRSQHRLTDRREHRLHGRIATGSDETE